MIAGSFGFAADSFARGGIAGIAATFGEAAGAVSFVAAGDGAAFVGAVGAVSAALAAGCGVGLLL